MTKELKKTIGNVEITRPLADLIKPMWAQIDLPNVEGTVLDEWVLSHGGFINLPFTIENVFGKIIQKVLIPACRTDLVAGHVILSTLQLEAERLIHAVKDYANRRVSEDFVKERAFFVHAAMAQEMCGKDGLINKFLLGFRAKFSGKGHIATSHAIRHDEIGIPYHIYEKFLEEWKRRCVTANLSEELPPYVIVWRNPLLHKDSMRKLFIKSTGSNRFVIHPVITKGMGADSDGDLIEITLGYPDIQIQEEWSTACWDKEFLIIDQNPVPDFEHIQDDASRRLSQFIVIGPHDLEDPVSSPAIQALCKADDINIDDLVAFYKGKSAKEIMDDDEAVARGIILQKSEIGRIGSAACRARVLANGDPVISNAADIISERAAQYLFDSKHKLDDRYVKLAHVLRKDKGLSREDAEKMLTECGITPASVKPYLDVLYAREGSLNEQVDIMNPTFHLVFDPMVHQLQGSASILTDAVNKVKQAFSHDDENLLIRELKQRTLNLPKEEGADVHKG